VYKLGNKNPAAGVFWMIASTNLSFMNTVFTPRSLSVFPLSLLCFAASSQSCPRIEKGEINLVTVDGGGNCTYRVDFTMTVTGSNKSIRAIVSCGTTQALNECFTVSSTQNSVPFSSGTFSCPCASSKTLILSSFTSSDCSGTSCGTFGDVLPVSLLSVSLEKRNNLSCLTWKVAQESSLEKYIIEYSADALRYFPAGTVAALNSSKEHTYSFCDPVNRESGFYRIAIISLAGDVKYSTVVRFTSDKENKADIYPNPVTTHLHITLPLSGRLNQADFEIYSADGKLVLAGKLLQPFIDVSALQKGIYSLHLKKGTERLAVKNFIRN
jgi:hypothetical protein